VNSKTNYTVVGAFVLGSLALIVFFVIWLLQPTNEQQMQRYRIEFGESVSGLNVDSPVKFRGVTVGKVRSIRISPKNVEKIEVIIEVLKSTPIKVDTVAKLKAQGITGLSYIDLSRGSEAAALLHPKHKNDIPLIPSEPSFFVTLERSFGSASENIPELLLRIKTLLGDDNQQEVTRFLHHLANVSERLDSALTPERFEHIDTTVVRIGSLAESLEAKLPVLEKLANSGDAMAEQARVSLASLQESFAAMAETMRVINMRNKNGDYSVKETMGPGMAQFEMTMRKMERSLILLNQMLQRYENSPADMLFQHQPPLVGPGEKQ
jgi:phospholipid/cholesterol/gamma-HCH transport system substrate-binding protein